MEVSHAGFRDSVRRRIMAAPLFLPLAAVCGALWGAWLWGITLAAVLAAFWCCRWKVLFACVLCVCIVLLQQARTEHRQAALYHAAESAAPLILEGTVERSLNNGCILQDAATGARVVLRGKQAQYRAGERIRAAVQLLPTEEAPIRGMFDSAAWLRSNGLAASAACIHSEYMGRRFSWAALRGVADATRAFLAALLMPEGEEADARAQVLCALVLGDKTYSDPETVNVFKRGGCLHIFAVSGLHVGIIAGIIYFILSRLMIRSRLRTALLLLLTALYVVMTGMAVPALRAFLMLALLLSGRELRRPVSMVNLWSAAALAVLLLSPWQIHNAGFLLSFAVYAAIGIGIRYGMRAGAWLRPDAFLPRRIYNRRERFLVASDYWLRGLVVMSLSAWLAALPITMAYFHTFNLYGVLVNIIITPLLLPTMLCGLLSMLPWVGVYLHTAAMQCASCLLGIVGFFSGLPGAYSSVQTPQPADALLVMHTAYADSICVLGNPGVLLNCGNEKTARFCTEPALFHGGFRPFLMVSTGKRAACGGGFGVLKSAFPDMQLLEAWRMHESLLRYKTPAGTVTLVLPSADINPSPVQNSAPVVLWEGAERRVLYVGDASLLTFERIPAALLCADVVVCGYNPALPVTPRFVSELLPKAQLILLPTAAAYEEADLPNPETVKMIRIGPENKCYLSPSSQR